MDSNGIMITPYFMKISHLVQRLKMACIHMGAGNGDLINHINYLSSKKRVD